MVARVGMCVPSDAHTLDHQRMNGSAWPHMRRGAFFSSRHHHDIWACLAFSSETTKTKTAHVYDYCRESIWAEAVGVYFERN